MNSILILSTIIFNLAILLLCFLVSAVLFKKTSYIYTIISLFSFYTLLALFSYFLGAYNRIFVLVFFVIIVILLIYFYFKDKKEINAIFCSLFKKIKENKIYIISILGIFFIHLLVLVFVASNWAVPHGIDSAIHGITFLGTSIKGGNNELYPMGMHFLIRLSTDMLNIRFLEVFIGIAIIFYVLYLSVLFFWINLFGKKLQASKSLMAALFFALSSISVELYNNFLNGSLSHLYAPLVLISSISVFCFLLKSKSNEKLIAFVNFIFILNLFYFHTITIIYFLIILFVFRIFYEEKYNKFFIPSFIFAIILAIPAHARLLGMEIYKPALLGITALFLTFDLIVFFSRKIKKEKLEKFLSWRGWYILLVVFSVLNFSVFDKYQNWYSWVFVFLTIISVLYFYKNKDIKIANALVLIMLVLHIIFYSVFELNFIPFPSGSKLIGKLIYYYALGPGMVLLISLFALLNFSKIKLKTNFAAAIIILIFLPIFINRAVDGKFDFLGNDKFVVSRFSDNAKFGQFGTKNDLLLFEWMSKNISNNSKVLNLGGLYSAWGFLSEVKFLYSPTGGYLNFVKDTKMRFRDLLSGNIDRIFEIKETGVDYLFIPEDYAISFFSPVFEVVNQIGRSRLYKIKNRKEFADKNFLHITAKEIISQNLSNVLLSLDYPLDNSVYQFDRKGFEARLPVLKMKPNAEIYLNFDKARNGNIEIYIASNNFHWEIMTVPEGKKIDLQNFSLNKPVVINNAEEIFGIILKNISRQEQQITWVDVVY